MFLQTPSHGRSFVGKIDITAAPTWLRVDELKNTATTLVYRLILIPPAPLARKSCTRDGPRSVHGDVVRRQTGFLQNPGCGNIQMTRYLPKPSDGTHRPRENT
jgi:hypothetical protein